MRPSGLFVVMLLALDFVPTATYAQNADSLAQRTAMESQRIRTGDTLKGVNYFVKIPPQDSSWDKKMPTVNPLKPVRKGRK